MKTVVRVVLVFVLVALILPAVVSACPTCKDAVADGEYPGGAASLGHGFYYSILLMIAVPWSAVMTVGFLIYRKQRRLKLERAGAQP